MRMHFGGKLIGLILVVAFVSLGLIGLVLPLIPGLLFLALAAALIARHSPSARRRMRRHRGVGRWLDHADGFIDSDAMTKLKLGALYAAKALVDGAETLIRAAGSLRDWLRDRIR